MTPDTEAPDSTVEEPSLRDSIEAAITEHVEVDPNASPEAGGVASLAAPPEAPLRDPAAPPAPGAPRAAPAAPSAEPMAPAPASWKAGLREHWKTLAPDVQAEIHRREGEQVERLRENAHMRSMIGRFNAVVEPYRALMEAEGGEPLSAFHDYLRAATLLRTGPPGDRAAFVAALVQRYAVPLDALDAHLASAIRGGGQMPVYPNAQAGMPPQMPQQQQFRDPRLDALLQQVEQQNADGIRGEVAAFKADGKHEFFDDVRLTMADVMDAAAKRGIEMSMEDAYQRAIMIEPEVRKVVESRGMRMSASQAARTLAAARHASSSLTTGPAPPAARMAVSAGANPSVRASLEAAIDTLHTSA